MTATELGEAIDALHVQGMSPQAIATTLKVGRWAVVAHLAAANELQEFNTPRRRCADPLPEVPRHVDAWERLVWVLGVRL